MTVFALRSFLAAMFIVLLVTGITVHRGVFITIVSVAVFAGHFNMLVPKFVTGFVVVEPYLFPVLFNVAIGAGGTHLSIMLIVLVVAAITIERRVAILSLGFVARLALDLLCIGMGAEKGEIGLRMVEGPFVDRRDILRSALVFRMASLAFALFFEPSMVALLLLDILASFFMAIQTECCLGRLVESLMTFGAGLLPLGMAFDHLARHEGGFDAVSPGIASQA